MEISAFGLELLNRVQFALTVMFHFIFVPLTFGLIMLMLFGEARYFFTKNEMYRELVEGGSKIFIINATIAIVTGITMEFQFGTNGAEYSTYMGDIFAGPLAIEALMAFFLESTFLGLGIFARHKMGSGLRLLTIAMIFLGVHLSGVGIIVANAFMQYPVGYSIDPETGYLVLESAGELFTNPYAIYMYVHTVLAGYIVGGMFVAGVSTGQLRKFDTMSIMTRVFWKKGLKYGAVVVFLATLVTSIWGDQYAKYITEVNPAKAAAFENVGVTEDYMPFYAVQVPDAENETNAVELFAIPGLGSGMYCGDPSCEVTGYDEIPDDQQPTATEITIVFGAFRIMVMSAMFLMIWAVLLLLLNHTNNFAKRRKFIYATVAVVAVPYIATFSGGIVAEVGRQPGTVYGLMKTSEAYSQDVPGIMIIISMFLVTILYVMFFFIFVYLMKKQLKVSPNVDNIKIDKYITKFNVVEAEEIKYKLENNEKEILIIFENKNEEYMILVNEQIFIDNVKDSIAIPKVDFNKKLVADIKIKIAGSKR